MPSLPDVATVAESGFSNYEDYTWIAFFAPARTSKAIVDQLNHQIAAILQLPETKKRLAVLGFDAVEHARAVHRLHQDRDREVGEGHQGIGRAGGLAT
jgi:tripartite-type tricarboxylate transporter receptor subunit TctC